MTKKSRALSAAAALAAGALSFTFLTATPALAAEVTNTIAEVQGTGATTPLAGTTVTVEGVVTGYYAPPSNFRGLYLQTAGSGGDDDATPDASDGIFVYFNTANPDVGVGDLVRVTGVAGENAGQTQVSATAAANFELIQADAGLPASTPLPDSVVGGAREELEGMLVQPTGEYRLASTHELFNFGSLWLSAGGEVVKSTETTDAGPAADAIAASNLARRLVVDDGYSIQVGNASHVGDQPYFTKDTVVRIGDTFVPPEKPMILGYGFNLWRLQPQVPITDASDASYKPTFTSTNPRPASAPEVGGDVQFGSFNVFNYFTTFGGDARGAANPAEFAIQKSKIVTAINGLGADVVALEEIENSVELGEPVDEALGDLVDGLNAAAGAGTWAFVPTPDVLAVPGANDLITTAIIYKPSVVTPVGDSFADPDPVWDIARVPVAQTFSFDDRTVTVVANHFKSKSPPTGGGTEPADGQGFFNAERVAQAEELVTFTDGIAADPAKGDDIILLGDFNAYAQEDPIQVLTEAGFVDLVPEKTDDQYTYTFNGELGSLDHALATKSLARSVTGVGVWGINSPEWGDRGYEFAATDPDSPYRSSDHDPVVLGVAADEPPVVIDLLSINDFHGRLEAVPPIAGAAVMGGMVNHYEALNPNTLFVGAGDLIGASTFTSFIQQDQPTIDAFNAMGLDASSFGNHEFDQGRDDVDNRVLPEADWPYLAANLYDRATNAPAYQEYELREFDGVTIGFVGAVTEELPSLVSPGGIASLEVRGIVPEVNRVADQLSDGNEANGEADVVILLVHEGAATPALSSSTDDSAFGRIVSGLDADVDMIISAHTHLAYLHEIPIAGTDRTRVVMSSGQYGQVYGHSLITVDPNSGELIDIESENLPLAGAFPPDPVVEKIVTDAVNAANPLGDVSLGSITEDIKRGRQTSGSENRGSESTIGNLIAEAQLAATQDLGTQLAIMNPGGIRADLLYASSKPVDPDGNVTYREAATAQSFANTLVTMTLTGAQLKTVLEQQWQPAGAQRPFLRLGLSSGFEYTYDPTAATGAHITSMSLDGEPVTPDQTFKIVVNSFLSTGGDNFFELANGTGKADSGRVDLEALVDYIGDNSPVAPDYSQRSVGVVLTPPADGVAYQAGESVTLSLSSLLMSNGGPTSGDATVSLGDQVLGTGPIAFTIVDTQDEQGTASVTITVPDGVTGTQYLTVAGPGGTSVQVPIEVAAPAEPVDTRLQASPSRLLVFGNQVVNYRVTATAADGSEPVGTVTVYDGRRVLTTITLDAGDNGRATVQLPRLSRGLHLLTAVFTGDGFERSVSFPAPVLVL